MASVAPTPASPTKPSSPANKDPVPSPTQVAQLVHHAVVSHLRDGMQIAYVETPPLQKGVTQASFIDDATKLGPVMEMTVDLTPPSAPASYVVAPRATSC
jgi:hypothetical protein